MVGEASQVVVEIQDLEMEKAMVVTVLIRTVAAILLKGVIEMVCHLLPLRIEGQHGDEMIDPTRDYLHDHLQSLEIIFHMTLAGRMVVMGIDLGLEISSVNVHFQEAGAVELILTLTFQPTALTAADFRGMIVVDETKGMTAVTTEIGIG